MRAQAPFARRASVASFGKEVKMRWAETPWSDNIFTERQNDVRSQDSIATHDDCHIVQRRVGIEDIEQERHCESCIENDAAIGILL
jgi:hypothetical protein